MSEHKTLQFELEEYENEKGQRPHAKWLASLEPANRARVTVSLRRLESGNTSNVKSLGGGLSELRLNFGPGFRVYFAHSGLKIILLLAGGSKQRQSDDIARAREFWQEYQERSRSQINASKPQFQRNRS